MAATPQDALERTCPRRELYTGVGRTASLWSLVSGTLLCGLLLQAGLVVGLITDRGFLEVRLVGDEIEQFERWTGERLLKAEAEAAPAQPEAADPPAAADAAPPGAAEAAAASTLESHRVYEEHGLLPVVWRSRKMWWGPGLAAAYRRFPALRQNSWALPTLLGLAIITWLLREWSLGQLRTTCRGAAQEVAARLRRQLHRQALRLGTEDIDGGRVSHAIALFTDVTDRLRLGLFDWLQRVTRYPVELAFLALAALSVEVLLTLQWVFPLLLGGYLIVRGQRQAEQRRRLAEDRSRSELRQLAEGLRSARLVRGYGLDAVEQEQFQARMQRYEHETRVQSRIVDDPLWLRLAVTLGCAVIALLLLFLLCAKILVREITPPGAAVFLAAVVLGLRAVAELRRLPGLRSEVSLAADQVWRYLDLLPTVSQAVGARFVQPLSRTLHFEDVTLVTPDQRVLLQHADLQLAAGRTYAVLSLDPLEARALVFLLPRFLEPQSGRVLFDGEDIAWGTLESLRAEAVLVSADDPALTGTVLDNIRAGRAEVTLSQATEAAKEARAHNFIQRLPQGYETQLSGRDDPLDAGQRLRLALARALLRNPAVLIIEEPDAPLDEDTKQLLDDTYTRICPGRTVFFLPRRLTTVRRADEVILLHRGRIEALGPQPQLVKESPLYRHWEYINFHEFRHNGRP